MLASSRTQKNLFMELIEMKKLSLKTIYNCQLLKILLACGLGSFPSKYKIE